MVRTERYYPFRCCGVRRAPHRTVRGIMGNFGSRRKKITRQVVKAVSKLEEEWEQYVRDGLLLAMG